MNRTVRFLILLVLLARVSLPAQGADASPIDAARFDRHVEMLTRDPHRLSGTEEARRAAAYIEEQLRALPGGEFLEQHFAFPQEMVARCELLADGRTIALQPFMANGLRPAVTPSGGIAGPLVYIDNRLVAARDVSDWGGLRDSLSDDRLGEALRAAAATRRVDLPGGDVLATDGAEQARFLGIFNELLLEVDLPAPGPGTDAPRRFRKLLAARERGPLASGDRILLNRYLLSVHLPSVAPPATDGFRTDGLSMDGAIAVADFSSENAINESLRLGARAIIFIGGPGNTRSDIEDKRTYTPADVPRFYISREDALASSLLSAEQATLHSMVRWEKREGRNLFLWLPGTDPDFATTTAEGEPSTEEFTILSAAYDSRGIVPRNAPCMESAANCAALLETARYLQTNRPRRNVLVAFFDNHANFLEGGRRFYAAYRRRMGDEFGDARIPTLEDRFSYIEKERTYIRENLEFLAEDDLYNSKHPRKREALHNLDQQAKYRYGLVLEDLQSIRIRMRELEAEDLPWEHLLPEEDRLEDLQAQWQFVRESIRDETPIEDMWEDELEELTGQIEAIGPQDEAEEASAEDAVLRKRLERLRSRRENVEANARKAMERFEDLLHNLKDLHQQRLDELAAIERYLQDDRAVTTPFASATPTGHISFRFTAGARHWFGFTDLNMTEQHAILYNDLLEHARHRLEQDGRLDDFHFVWASSNPRDREYYRSFLSAEEALLADDFLIPNFIFETEIDPAPSAGVPDSRLPLEALRPIREQAAESLFLIDLLTNESWASVSNQVLNEGDVFIEGYEWKPSEDSAEGHRVKSFGFGQTEANTPEPFALVHLRQKSAVEAEASREFAERREILTYADGNGIYEWTSVERWIEATILSAQFGENMRFRKISISNPGGPVADVSTGWANAGFYEPKTMSGKFTIVSMFLAGKPGHLVGKSIPFGEPFESISFLMLNARTDSPYDRKHLSFDQQRGIGAFWVDRPMGVKFVYRHPRIDDEVAVFINATKDRPAGNGYGEGARGLEVTGFPTIDLRSLTAPDMFRLNESRLAKLRSRNIILNALEFLHSQSRHYLDLSLEAARENRYADAQINAALVNSIERRIYRPVMDTTNDMVAAATILLLLAVPFASALQSLLIPTYSIYRKIISFCVFFLLTFLMLYFTHPAFSFSATPAVIILAFVIMLMSSVSIWIISGKFSYEVKKLQGLATAAHTFEQSLVGSIGAAVGLAISTMRRRPVRTLLTIITVVMLTFTILSFISFQSERTVNLYPKGTAEDSSTRLMVRRKVWKTMDPSVLGDIRRLLGDEYRVHGRYWWVRELEPNMPMEEIAIPLRAGNGRGDKAGSVMTIATEELDEISGLRDVLPADPDALAAFRAGRGVFLSGRMTESLQLEPGDGIDVGGTQTTFLGAFDERLITNINQVDGTSLIPVNFSLSQMALGQYETTGSAGGSGRDAQSDLERLFEGVDPESLEPVEPHKLVLAPVGMPLRKAVLKAVVIWPEGPTNVEDLAEKLAVIWTDGVFVNRGGERSFYFYGETFGVLGVWDILIPLLLGGLIVFSTMLGSVIDREKEIYTFSALGLPPKSIAMLFFFEAGIYAVIGGVGGYLMSQVVTRVLEFLSAYGLFQAPEMNYSSSMAIRTILIVMATVIVSTIYPALQAAAKATAQTSRRWRVPEPRNDVCEFDFPFTISRYDITGIICFIREHFINHADRTVGSFAATDPEVAREPEHGMAALRATIWLQPFDQGISQSFEMSASPSEIEEVCEIHIRLARLSGPPSAWKRSYVVFLENLRSQFLLWRTLDDSARDHYLTIADELEERLELAPPPDPDESGPTAVTGTETPDHG